jgi:acyl-CoA synthetase (AMP-forming)/AMP-acid ligase II
MLSVADGLSVQASRYPERAALLVVGETVTFGELERRVHAAAHLLWSLGIRPGDRVAALLPNGATLVELLFAVARVGAVLCPLHLRWGEAELRAMLGDCSPRLLVVTPYLLEVARAAVGAGTQILPDLAPDDPRPGYAQLRDGQPPEPFPPQVADTAPWLMVYTSGTTGRAKGALRSQRSDVLLGLTLAAALGVGPEDVAFACLPLYHVNAIWLVTLSLCLGIPCHLHTPARYQPARLVHELEASGATYASLIPTQLHHLADEVAAGRVRCPRLRLLLTSSAPLSPALRDRLLGLLPGTKLAELYGATELGAVSLAWHAPEEPAGSVGFPLPGVRVRLLGPDRRPVAPGQVGELFVESPMLMEAYFGRPPETEAARAGTYLSVGDLARQDAQGRLYLVERLADTIISGGENVYPTEVEQALLSHPAVAAAAVIGVPEEVRGETVAAVVVPREGHAPSVADLAGHCRRLLAPYKRPRLFAFATELPLLPTGKVARRVVRERWLAGEYRPVAG